MQMGCEQNSAKWHELTWGPECALINEPRILFSRPRVKQCLMAYSVILYNGLALANLYRIKNGY